MPNDTRPRWPTYQDLTATSGKPMLSQNDNPKRLTHFTTQRHGEDLASYTDSGTHYVNIASKTTSSNQQPMWIILKRLRMAVSRWIGGTSKPSASNAIHVRVTPHELAVVNKCSTKGPYDINHPTIEVAFGDGVPAEVAASLTAELLLMHTVFWIRKLEANTGGKYYKEYRDAMDDMYMEPYDEDGIIAINKDQ